MADESAARPADLVDRDFRAAAPNLLWVCDLTYLKTLEGFLYRRELYGRYRWRRWRWVDV